MFEFWMILGMFAVTFGVRYPVLAFASKVSLPPVIRQALNYVFPAVLAAIVVPAVLIPDGVTPNLSITSPHLLGAIAAIAVSYRTRNLIWTIVVGMGVFLGLRVIM